MTARGRWWKSPAEIKPLTEDRKVLVHRYMIDADEAQTLRQAAEEAERQASEALVLRQEAERRAAEELARRQAAEEANRRAAEELAQRQVDEEAERRAAWELALRQVVEEAERRAAEELAQRRAAEEAERQAAEELARREEPEMPATLAVAVERALLQAPTEGNAGLEPAEVQPDGREEERTATGGLPIHGWAQAAAERRERHSNPDWPRELVRLREEAQRSR